MSATLKFVLENLAAEYEEDDPVAKDLMLLVRLIDSELLSWDDETVKLSSCFGATLVCRKDLEGEK